MDNFLSFKTLFGMLQKEMVAKAKSSEKLKSPSDNIL